MAALRILRRTMRILHRQHILLRKLIKLKSSDLTAVKSDEKEEQPCLRQNAAK